MPKSKPDESKPDGDKVMRTPRAAVPEDQRQRSTEIVGLALEKLGGNASELARLTGVSANTAAQWRRGAIPGPEYLATVAPLAGYTLQEAQNYIYGGVRDPVDVDRLMKDVRQLSSEQLLEFHLQFCQYLNQIIEDKPARKLPVIYKSDPLRSNRKRA